jgi:hypothetical protein
MVKFGISVHVPTLIQNHRMIVPERQMERAPAPAQFVPQYLYRGRENAGRTTRAHLGRSDVSRFEAKTNFKHG